jgi:carboxyl-terminal processing protease
VQAARTDAEYYKVLRRCMALLKDGHTSVWGPSDAPEGRLPFSLAKVEGLAVIVQVCPAAAIQQEASRRQFAAANLRLGEAVTQIDGRPIEQILNDEIYPTLSASTVQARDCEAYPQLTMGRYDSQAVLRIRGLSEGEREVTLARARYRWDKGEAQPFMRDLGHGILCLTLDSFGSDDSAERMIADMDNILAAKALVLDVRDNGGGSTEFAGHVLSFLIDRPVQGSKWKTRKYLPAYRAWGQPEQWHEGNHGVIQPHEGKRYGGPVVVLAGPATYSAAEDFVVAFQTAQRGKVIGEPTNGSTGQPLTIKLPGGGGARICTKHDMYPDGREFIGIGVIPDIEVAPTRQDIAAGRDVVLDKALEVLKAAGG